MNRMNQRGRRMGLRAAFAPEECRPLADRNAIVAWIESRAMTAREYLSHLLREDLSLAESLHEAYVPVAIHRRLALTLFIDYAHAQSLALGEVAVLLGNACAVSTEALNYLIGACMREGRAWEDLAEWSEVEDAA